MTQDFTPVRAHYQQAITDTPALLGDIAARLDRFDGKLTADRAGNFDQFHVGGLAATAELARRVALDAGMKVLDAGAGLGGPSRFLAEHYGVDVEGVDLTPAYVEVARMLARKAGLDSKVRYHVGSITDLPFAPATFDIVWSQHVVMNIADRDTLYRELHRVLKRAGRFVFYDPYVPDNGLPPQYPLPWAERAEASTLLTRNATVAALEGAGFSMIAWDDVTQLAQQWIAAASPPAQASATPPDPAEADRPAFGPGLLIGPRIAPMVANFGKNLVDGRIRLVMGLCEAR